MSFKYNDEGIRTSKTVNGVTTNYYLEGSRIIAEETNGNITVYLYNSTGIVGYQYHASSYAADVWDLYFYDKNLQGDIVAIYTSAGVKKASYAYDAWGNATITYHNGASSSSINNPFTYRGYYFDKDLGLYYLNSRYYDSNTSRFISADTIGYLGADGGLNSYNLYAYCGNNPIMCSDPEGHLFGIIVAIVASAAVVGATVGGASAYNSAKSSGVKCDKLIKALLFGAAKGAAVGVAIAAVACAVGTSVSTYGVFSTGAAVTITTALSITAKAE